MLQRFVPVGNARACEQRSSLILWAADGPEGVISGNIYMELRVDSTAGYCLG